MPSILAKVSGNVVYLVQIGRSQKDLVFGSAQIIESHHVIEDDRIERAVGPRISELDCVYQVVGDYTAGKIADQYRDPTSTCGMQVNDLIVEVVGLYNCTI
ncbi:MAG: hypothetical protein ACRD1R_15565 [Acidobacteriota bacterium]